MVCKKIIVCHKVYQFFCKFLSNFVPILCCDKKMRPILAVQKYLNPLMKIITIYIFGLKFKWCTALIDSK